MNLPRMFRPRSRWLLSSVLCAAPFAAALELAPAFTDHAVLQRDVHVPVWGWDDQPGATVTVAYAGQVKETRVNAAGVWRADLDPMAARTEGADLVVTRGNVTITLRDVVIGEVWLASGQSNMEWPVASSRGFDDEKARPANPLVRHLRVEHVGADLPVARVQTSGWTIAAPDTVGGFTGVGYFFARALAAELQVPVGILNASWGGTPIESWLPEGVLRASTAGPGFDARWRAAMKVFPQRYAEQPALEAAWAKAIEDNRTKGTPITMPWPRPPMGPGSAYGPGTLHNGMILPLAPYALRGGLWYQGESNVGRPAEYTELLPALAASWRSAFLLREFPFLVVQLPNFSDNGKATGRGWAFLREAQAAGVSRIPGGGLAVTIDGDEPDNLHPVDKRPVGERLARIALRQVHGRDDVAASGPVFESAVREGTAMRVKFRHAAGLALRPGDPTGFEVAGADRVFHPAAAALDGETVLVSSAAVPEPVAVRYAFTNAPPSTLANAAGLPAAPFRTDDWP